MDLINEIINIHTGRKLPPAFDPLSNPGTSRLLFQLIMIGPMTPTQIAEKLGVKPPSVIDQLVRLRRIQLVKLGKKEGKQQWYQLDWRRLVDVGVTRAFQLPQPDLKEDAQIEALTDQFLENHLFRDFFKNYIEIRLTETPFNLIIARQWTFAQLMEDFRTTVVGMLSDKPFLESLEPHDPHELEDLRRLWNDLENWKSLSLHVPNISRLAFVRALRKCGFP